MHARRQGPRHLSAEGSAGVVGVPGGGLQHEEPLDGGVQELAEEALLAGGVLGELLPLDGHALDLLLDLGGDDGGVAHEGHDAVHDVAVGGRDLGGGRRRSHRHEGEERHGEVSESHHGSS